MVWIGEDHEVSPYTSHPKHHQPENRNERENSSRCERKEKDWIALCVQAKDTVTYSSSL